MPSQGSEERFKLWWDLYQRKEGFGAAKKKFCALPKDVQEHIIAVTPAYVAWKSERKYRPMPCTFLNQQRYYDEIPAQDDPLDEFTQEDLAAIAAIESGVQDEGGK